MPDRRFLRQDYGWAPVRFRILSTVLGQEVVVEVTLTQHRRDANQPH